MSSADEVSLDQLEKFHRVSTATLTTQLLARGLRNTFLGDVRPLRPDVRIVGRAVTLRYAPAREDLWVGKAFDNRSNLQRLAVELVGPGDVLVIDARGDTSGAALGHILATRVMIRGAAGIVTDGAFRDSPELSKLDMPLYAAAAHAAPSPPIHHPVDMNVPIGCGGVLVFPGDVVVGDAEGVVVVPQEMAIEIAKLAEQQEQIESRILERVRAGESIVDLYPPSPNVLADLRRQADLPELGPASSAGAPASRNRPPA